MRGDIEDKRETESRGEEKEGQSEKRWRELNERRDRGREGDNERREKGDSEREETKRGVGEIAIREGETVREK